MYYFQNQISVTNPKISYDEVSNVPLNEHKLVPTYPISSLELDLVPNLDGFIPFVLTLLSCKVSEL